jgi:phosphodiesterase/alkaline phosphatase D-like protein
MARLILGHTTDTTIKIWVRATERWPVAFVDVLDAASVKTAPTKVIETVQAEFNTGVVEWSGLVPDTAYRAKVSFGKTKKSKPAERVKEAYTEGRFRTFAKEGSGQDFSFLLGSCNLHSLGFIEKPDQAWLQISKIASSTDARFMIHAGDQIYADIPFRPDISLKHYRDKYLDAWEDCVPARKMLTELPHYMILDDHEIINNFDNNMDSGTLDHARLAEMAMKVYWEFQHSHNAHSATPGRHYHYSFSYSDTPFFVMDTRYHRFSRKNQMIAPEQETELLGWLSTHKDKTKFIVTSVPFVAEVKDPEKDKWCDPVYDQQRGRILDHILKNDIARVIFLTGDMHAALHATLKVTDTSGKSCVVHELMSSPINQLTPDWTVERQFEPSPPQRLINGGLTLKSNIDKSSYLGKHSNVMAIDVLANGKIRYRVFRTTDKSMTPLKTKTFTL